MRPGEVKLRVYATSGILDPIRGLYISRKDCVGEPSRRSKTPWRLVMAQRACRYKIGGVSSVRGSAVINLTQGFLLVL